MSVGTADDEFFVRGLGLADIVAIFDANREQVSAVFAEIAIRPDAEMVLADMGGFATNLARGAPRVVAHIIARAADEEDPGLAEALPFPVQIDALEKVAQLTFATEAAAKKVMETIIRMASGVRRAALKP
jgi:hypothetical protein